MLEITPQETKATILPFICGSFSQFTGLMSVANWCGYGMWGSSHLMFTGKKNGEGLRIWSDHQKMMTSHLVYAAGHGCFRFMNYIHKASLRSVAMEAPSSLICHPW